MMKKKFLASLLTLCMVLTLLPTAALATDPPAPSFAVQIGSTVLEDGGYYVALSPTQDGEIVNKVEEADKGTAYLHYAADAAGGTLTVAGSMDLTAAADRSALAFSGGTLTIQSSASAALRFLDNNSSAALICGTGDDSSLICDSDTMLLYLKGGTASAIDVAKDVTLHISKTITISSKGGAPTIRAGGNVTLWSSYESDDFSGIRVKNEADTNGGPAITAGGAISVTATENHITLSTTGPELLGGAGATAPTLSAPHGNIFTTYDGRDWITLPGKTQAYLYGGFCGDGLDLTTPPAEVTLYHADTGAALYTPADDATPAKLELDGTAISADGTAVEHVGDLTLVLSGDSSLSSNTQDAVVSVRDDLTITGTGTLHMDGDPSISAENLTVDAGVTLFCYNGAVNSIGFVCDAQMTVAGTVYSQIGFDAGKLIVAATGVIDAGGRSYTSNVPTVAPGGKLNALVTIMGHSITHIAYGAAVLNHAQLTVVGDQTLTVSAGSSLTIGSMGDVAIDGTLTIEPGGSVINDGLLHFPEGTTVEDIKDYGLTGDGVVRVGDLTYGNDGTLKHFPTHGSLDFSGATTDAGALTEDGYHWDSAQKTLTIQGLYLRGEPSSPAMTLPDGAKLVVQGENTLVGGETVISGGALTLSGDSGAALLLSVAGIYGINCSGAVTLSGSVAVTTKGALVGIYGSSITIGDNVAVTVNDASYALESTADGMTIGGNAVVTVNRPSMRGLSSTGVLTIDGSATVAVSNGGDDGLVCGDDIIIGSGATVSVVDTSYGIHGEGDITIAGTVTVHTIHDGIFSLKYDAMPVIAITGGTTTVTTTEPHAAAIFSGAHYDNGLPGTLVPTADVLKFAGGYLPAAYALGSLVNDPEVFCAVIPAGGALAYDENGEITGAASSVTLEAPVAPPPSGGGTVTRPVPKPEPPKTDSVTGNTEVSVSVKPSTKGDTSSATVPDKSIQNAIAAAEKEAAKTGGSASVTVNVDAPEGAKTVETTLPSKSLTAVADGKTDGLKISTPVADLFFDDLALKTITASAGKNVKISASQVDTDGLTDAQREQVGDAPVFDFTVTSDGKTISDFGGGTATVTVPYAPKDGENPEFVTVWLLDDTGKLIPIEAKYADGKITFETGHFSRYAIGYLPFADVKAGWSYESIVYAYQNKLFAGVGENKFAPDANMNRAMLWSVLYRMAGSPDKSETPATWYADAQKWAIAEKISDGANPDENVTREQLATILFRYAKATATAADMSKFADTNDISEFAKDGMTWAVECKILQGNEGKLNPQGTATRAEVATMLQRFAGISK